MSKIIDAEDILAAARNCVECIYMAATDLSNEHRNPIHAVADIASKKIDEAIAVLEDYWGGPNASPVPAAPAAKPKSPAARTKMRSK